MDRTPFNLTNNKTLQVISCSSTKHRQESSKKSSQPIPIKVSDSKSEYQQCNSISADKAYYDMLTWQMYNLITEARRMRAYSRLSQSDICNSEYYVGGRNLYKPTNHTVRLGLAKSPGNIDELQEQEPPNSSSITEKEEKIDDDGSHIFHLEV